MKVINYAPYSQAPAKPSGKTTVSLLRTEEETDTPALPFGEETAATLELTDPWERVKEAADEAKNAGAAKASKAPGPNDESGRLTRQLVAAKSQEETLSVLTEAFKNMAEWRMAMMGGGDEARKAMGVVKRLTKLITRAMRKIKDLNREDGIRRDQKRAEKAEREHIARQLREELGRKMAERKHREKGYLRDAGRPLDYGRRGSEPMTPAELEARIMILAETMAQLTSGPAPAIASAAAPVSSGSGGGGSSGTEGGGETAPAAE